jgi:hypothetical protein
MYAMYIGIRRKWSFALQGDKGAGVMGKGVKAKLLKTLGVSMSRVREGCVCDSRC